MPRVYIEKNQKVPPMDGTIRNAMTAAGGTVVSITRDKTSDGPRATVDYTPGDGFDRRTFTQQLQSLGNGNTNSWLIYWGTTLGLRSEGVSGTLGTQYSITIHNASQIPNHRAIVFQKDPTLPADVKSLAWLSKVSQPDTEVTYTWTLDYNFVWGQVGELRSGVNYQAGQVLPADLTNHNQVTLSYSGGGFSFGATDANPTSGSLFVHEAADVPGYGNTDQGSVGIGMYGQGTFVLPTNPTGAGGGIQFTPHPQYWVAFGNYTQGEVVDESVLYAPAQVSFSGSSFHADCTFNGSDWTITYS